MHRRVIPKRRRDKCPECGRDTAYTYPWVSDWNGGLIRGSRRHFSKHKDPKTGKPCKGPERWV